MSKEEMTAEEQSALEAMQAPEKAEHEEPQGEPTSEEPKIEQEPAGEFKSSRSEKPPEGFVPHGAFHAEREQRKALEQRLADLEAKMQPQKEEEKAPEWVDPLIDPEGFRKYDEHRTRQLQDRLDRQEQERQEAVQRQERFQEAQRLEAEFAERTPDYQDAAKHLHEARIQELRNQGMADAEIPQQIAKDANMMFDAARQIGWNPAELLYQNALRRGYQPKARQQEQPSAADKMESLAKAQRETQSIGTTGGGDTSGRLTAAQLADMSEDEMRQLDPKEIARVMGA